jgi:hypothetical protein
MIMVRGMKRGRKEMRGKKMEVRNSSKGRIYRGAIRRIIELKEMEEDMRNLLICFL